MDKKDEEKKSDDEEDGEKDERDEKREEEDEQVPETRIEVEVPKIATDLGRELHFVKLPNFLSVESRPYDQETYEVRGRG